MKQDEILEGIKYYLRVKKLVIICIYFLSLEGYSKECDISRLKVRRFETTAQGDYLKHLYTE